ncbi:glycosyltransferase [Rhodococcus indonesiensis]
MQSFSSVADKDPTENPKIFITLGTIKPYRFDSAVDAVLGTGLATSTTVWQLGCTSRNDLPGQVYDTLPSRQFDDYVEDADVVVTHSGVGTILKILEAGKHPIVLPRRRSRGEHVDDHQMQIARLLQENGIASMVSPEMLSPREIIDATARTVLIKGASGVH